MMAGKISSLPIATLLSPAYATKPGYAGWANTNLCPGAIEPSLTLTLFAPHSTASTGARSRVPVAGSKVQKALSEPGRS